jgi:dihydropteroate synthase
MGILNVTPDSFSDGGRFVSAQAAVDGALGMIADGAVIIDVGPESTRPGAAAVGADEQIARAVPVIEGIRRRDARVMISIDTRLAPVARAALSAGANMVNDISALCDDPAMVEVIAEARVSVVLMHMKGRPADMQRGGGPAYEDAIAEIRAFLAERRDFAVSRGVDRENIVLDPGIGFGKRVEDNLRIIKHLDRIVDLGQPVLVGASRKSFIGHVLGIDDPAAREAASLACALWAVRSGTRIIRVHDVRSTVQTIRMQQAIERADAEGRSCS